MERENNNMMHEGSKESSTKANKLTVNPKQPTMFPFASSGRYLIFNSSLPNAYIGCITSELCTLMALR